MEITEVRVKLVEGGRDKLRAFCSITIDDAFVVRDLKVIDGTKGLFVAMPSRKLTSRCPRCGYKNQVRSNYCNDCGVTLPDEAHRNPREKIHADIAHPIHTECRENLQSVVVESYLEEVEASQQPGYRPRGDDDERYDLEESVNEPERVPVLAGSPEEEEPAPTYRGSERTFYEKEQVSEPKKTPERGWRTEGASRESGGGSERASSSENRRSSARSRGPLSESPPPDDNFSAGIF